jgi:hypothetical protein
MSTINDGGFAFPMPDRYGGANGMTLRQYYAGQALAGMLARYGAGMSQDTVTALVADCYEHADAMLKAEEVKP